MADRVDLHKPRDSQSEPSLLSLAMRWRPPTRRRFHEPIIAVAVVLAEKSEGRWKQGALLRERVLYVTQAQGRQRRRTHPRLSVGAYQLVKLEFRLRKDLGAAGVRYETDDSAPERAFRSRCIASKGLRLGDFLHCRDDRHVIEIDTPPFDS
jgi:hypothetical protein